MRKSPLRRLISLQKRFRELLESNSLQLGYVESLEKQVRVALNDTDQDIKIRILHNNISNKVELDVSGDRGFRFDDENLLNLPTKELVAILVKLLKREE